MTVLAPLQIRSSLADYPVYFSEVTDLDQRQPQSDVVLVDGFFRDRLRFDEEQAVIWIEVDEEAKSQPAILSVFMALKEAGFGRGCHLAAVGGGVVQDIATFVASLYMRGIKSSYAPTTFLGMMDSCLGGKSSINVGPYKNLIGNFHPPSRIDILPAFARCRPDIELAAGTAEADKIAFCRGDAFQNYEELVAPLLNKNWDEQQLAELIRATLNIKQWFIETDEFDQRERRLLNFGHTWGHALESATDFSIPHGPAVAIGMMAASLFTASEDGGPEASNLLSHCQQLLRPVLSTEQLKHFDAERFLLALGADKKHSPGYLHLIVPNSSDEGLGVQEIHIPANTESEYAILKAIQKALACLAQTKPAKITNTVASR